MNDHGEIVARISEKAGGEYHLRWYGNRGAFVSLEAAQAGLDRIIKEFNNHSHGGFL